MLKTIRYVLICSLIGNGIGTNGLDSPVAIHSISGGSGNTFEVGLCFSTEVFAL